MVEDKKHRDTMLYYITHEVCILFNLIKDSDLHSTSHICNSSTFWEAKKPRKIALYRKSK